MHIRELAKQLIHNVDNQTIDDLKAKLLCIANDLSDINQVPMITSDDDIDDILQEIDEVEEKDIKQKSQSVQK